MRYKGAFEMLWRLAEEYGDFVNGQAATYKREMGKIEATLEENKEVWAETYKEKYKAENNPYKAILKDVDRQRDKSKAAASVYLDKLEGELHKYFMGGIDPELAAKINTYQNLGMDLTDADVKILLEEAKTFPEKKCVCKLFDNVKERQLEKAKADKEAYGYGGGLDWAKVNYDTMLPDVDRYLKDFDTFKGVTMHFYNNYLGKKAELIDMPTNSPNAVADNSLVAMSAVGYLSHAAIFEAKEMFDELMEIAPGGSELTKEEYEQIDRALDPKYPHLAQMEAKRLSVEDPELGELLALDPRYADVVADEA